MIGTTSDLIRYVDQTINEVDKVNCFPGKLIYYNAETVRLLLKIFIACRVRGEAIISGDEKLPRMKSNSWKVWENPKALKTERFSRGFMP